MVSQVDYKKQIYDAFMDSNMSLREVADNFGAAYETVRGWGKQEAWHQKRINRQIGEELTEDVVGQAEAIRSALFFKITREDMDADSIAELVKAWKSLLEVREREPVVEEYNRDDLLAGL